MSQFQSPPDVSSVPSERVDEMDINTAENAAINDPQPKTSPTGNDNSSFSGVGQYNEITPEQAKKAGLPEQKHAGAVGYGPNFANRQRAVR